MNNILLQSLTPSRFNYLHKENNDFALWNTLSGSFIRISRKVYYSLEYGDISKLDDNDILKLTEIGALVEKHVDELEYFQSIAERRCKNAPWRYRILTTTACNAKCFYCYEKNVPLYSMTPETAERIAEFIENNYHTAPTLMPNIIEWFGGEPLMNVHACSRLCDILANKKIPFISEITTNGLLLNSSMLDDAIKFWNLKSMQITVDGVGKDYERIKCVHAGSFDKLINNIKAALEKGIHVNLRINETGNLDSEKALLSSLRELIGISRLLNIYISPLYPDAKYVSRECMERVLSLEQKLFELGFADEEIFYAFRTRYVRCFSCTSHGFTVAPDGRLYNCSHVLTENGCFGNVCEHDIYSERRGQYIQHFLSDECSNCVFLPLCAGGCRSAELGLAKMNQCFPYKSVIDMIASIRLKSL